jgi:hypothetical protein
LIDLNRYGIIAVPMVNLLEYVGNVHIFLGPYRGNPIALYLTRGTAGCEIAPKIYPWNEVIGKGETPNKAAADFEEKWKTKGLTPEMYTGPSWEGGIKPERPAPPKPPAAPKPAATAAAAATTPTPEKPAEPITDVRAGAPAGTGTAPQQPPNPPTKPEAVGTTTAPAQPEPVSTPNTASDSKVADEQTS